LRSHFVRPRGLRSGSCFIACLVSPLFLALFAAAAPAAPAESLVRITQLEDARAATDELRAFLGSDDASTRARAALALGRIGHPPDVAVLAPLLRDGQVEVRRTAAFALGEIEDSTAARALAAWLESGDEEDAEARALAVEAFGKLKAEPSTCQRALRDRSTRVVGAALLAAWQIPAPEAFDRVLELTSAEDPEVRWRATYCLMRFVGAPASGATPTAGGIALAPGPRSAAGARLRSLSADSDQRVRSQAARGLRGFADSTSTRALLALSRDADWRVRVEAVRALAAPQADGAPRSLVLANITPFLQDLAPNVRITALEALGVVTSVESALPELERATRDLRTRAQQVAFEALFTRAAASGSPLSASMEANVTRWTAELLASREWSLRTTAVRGLDLLPDARASELLQRLLADEPRVAKEAVEPWMRRRLKVDPTSALSVDPQMTTLAVHRDPVIRAIFLGALQSSLADSSVAWSAADRDTVATLARKMARLARRMDRENDVRLAVLDLAEANGEVASLRALARDALDDPDFIVRRRAGEVLRGFGETPVDGQSLDGGAAADPEDPEGAGEIAAALEWAQKDHWAVIETEGGALIAKLSSRDAPLTCWNFARLAGRGAYDRGAWHRVVPDFVFQDGCPRGDGYGGPGWTIRCEINRQRYTEGALGMALSGKDTGGSQFFFTHSDQPHLDGRYTVFGRLERGHELAPSLVQGSPIFSIRIVDEAP